MSIFLWVYITIHIDIMYIHIKRHKCIMHYSVHDALFYFQNNNENLKTNSSPSSLTILASWVISWVIKGYFLHLQHILQKQMEILSLPLAQAKNGKEHMQQEKLLAANEGSQHAHKGLFLPFGEGQGCCCSQCVHSKFPMGSQCVPQHVSISTSLCPLCFALNSTLVSYISSTKEENLIYKF